MNILKDVLGFVQKFDALLDKDGDPDGSAHAAAAAELNRFLPKWIAAKLYLERVRQLAHLDQLEERPAVHVSPDGEKIRSSFTYWDKLQNPEVLRPLVKELMQTFGALLEGLQIRNADDFVKAVEMVEEKLDGEFETRLSP